MPYKTPKSPFYYVRLSRLVWVGGLAFSADGSALPDHARLLEGVVCIETLVWQVFDFGHPRDCVGCRVYGVG